MERINKSRGRLSPLNHTPLLHDSRRGQTVPPLSLIGHASSAGQMAGFAQLRGSSSLQPPHQQQHHMQHHQQPHLHQQHQHQHHAQALPPLTLNRAHMQHIVEPIKRMSDEEIQALAAAEHRASPVGSTLQKRHRDKRPRLSSADRDNYNAKGTTKGHIHAVDNPNLADEMQTRSSSRRRQRMSLEGYVRDSSIDDEQHEDPQPQDDEPEQPIPLKTTLSKKLRKVNELAKKYKRKKEGAKENAAIKSKSEENGTEAVVNNKDKLQEKSSEGKTTQDEECGNAIDEAAGDALIPNTCGEEENENVDDKSDSVEYDSEAYEAFTKREYIHSDNDDDDDDTNTASDLSDKDEDVSLKWAVSETLSAMEVSYVRSEELKVNRGGTMSNETLMGRPGFTKDSQTFNTAMSSEALCGGGGNRLTGGSRKLRRYNDDRGGSPASQVLCNSALGRVIMDVETLRGLGLNHLVAEVSRGRSVSEECIEAAVGNILAGNCPVEMDGLRASLEDFFSDQYDDECQQQQHMTMDGSTQCTVNTDDDKPVEYTSNNEYTSDKEVIPRVSHSQENTGSDVQKENLKQKVNQVEELLDHLLLVREELVSRYASSDTEVIFGETELRELEDQIAGISSMSCSVHETTHTMTQNALQNSSNKGTEDATSHSSLNGSNLNQQVIETERQVRTQQEQFRALTSDLKHYEEHLVAAATAEHSDHVPPDDAQNDIRRRVADLEKTLLSSSALKARYKEHMSVLQQSQYEAKLLRLSQGSLRKSHEEFKQQVKIKERDARKYIKQLSEDLAEEQMNNAMLRDEVQDAHAAQREVEEHCSVMEHVDLAKCQRLSQMQGMCHSAMSMLHQYSDINKMNVSNDREHKPNTSNAQDGIEVSDHKDLGITTSTDEANPSLLQSALHSIASLHDQLRETVSDSEQYLNTDAQEAGMESCHGGTPTACFNGTQLLPISRRSMSLHNAAEERDRHLQYVNKALKDLDLLCKMKYEVCITLIADLTSKNAELVKVNTVNKDLLKKLLKSILEEDVQEEHLPEKVSVTQVKVSELKVLKETALKRRKEMEDKCQQLKEENMKLVKTTEEWQTEYNRLDRTYSSVQQANKKMEHMNKELQQEQMHLKMKSEEAQQEIIELNMRNGEFKVQITKLNAELEQTVKQLESINTEHQQEIKNIGNLNIEFQQKVKNMEKMNIEHQQERKNLEKRNTEHQQERKNVAKRYTEHQQEKKNLEKKNTEYEQKVNDLDEMNTEHKQEIKKLEKMNTEHKQEIKKLEKMNTEHKQEIKQLEKMNTEHKQEIKKLETMNTEHKQEIKKLGNMNIEYQQQVKELENMYKEAEMQFEKARGEFKQEQMQLQKENNDLKLSKEDICEQYKALKEQLLQEAQDSKDLNTLRAEREELLCTVRRYEEEKENLLDTLKHEQDEFQQKLEDEFEEKHKVLQEAFNKVAEEKDALKARVHQLEREKEELIPTENEEDLKVGLQECEKDRKALKKIQEDLREENDHLLKKIEELERENDRLLKKIEELEGDNERLLKKIEESEGDREEAHRAQEKWREKFQEMEEKFAQKHQVLQDAFNKLSEEKDELKLNVTSLEKENKPSLEHEGLEKENKELKEKLEVCHSNYEATFDTLVSERDELKRKIETLEQSNEVEVINWTAKLHELEERHEQELRTLKEAHEHLQHKKHALEKENRALQEELESLLNNNDDSWKTNTHSNETLHDQFEEEKKKLGEKIRGKEAEIEEWKEKVQKLEQDNGATTMLQDNTGELQAYNSQLIEDNAQLQTARKLAQEEIEELQDQVSDLQEKHEKMTHAQKDLREQLDVLQLHNDSLQDDLHKSSTGKAKLQDEMDDLADKFLTTGESRDSWDDSEDDQDEVHKVTVDKEELRAKVSQLEKQLRALQQEKESFHELLKEKEILQDTIADLQEELESCQKGENVWNEKEDKLTQERDRELRSLREEVDENFKINELLQATIGDMEHQKRELIEAADMAETKFKLLNENHQEQVRHLQEELGNVSKQKNFLSRQVEIKETELKSIESTWKQKLERIEKCNEESTETLYSSFMEAAEEKDAFKDRICSLETEKQLLAQERDQLKKQLDKYPGMVSELEVREQESSYEMQDKIDELVEEKTELQNKIHVLEKQLQDNNDHDNQNNDQDNKGNDQDHKDNDKNNDQNDNLKERQESWSREKRQLENRVSELEEAKKMMEEMKEKCLQEKRELKDRITDLEKENQELAANASLYYAGSNPGLDPDIRELEEKVRALEKEKRDFLNMQDAWRKRMQRAERNTLKKMVTKMDALNQAERQNIIRALETVHKEKAAIQKKYSALKEKLREDKKKCRSIDEQEESFDDLFVKEDLVNVYSFKTTCVEPPAKKKAEVRGGVPDEQSEGNRIVMSDSMDDIPEDIEHSTSIENVTSPDFSSDSLELLVIDPVRKVDNKPHTKTYQKGLGSVREMVMEEALALHPSDQRIYPHKRSELERKSSKRVKLAGDSAQELKLHSDEMIKLHIASQRSLQMQQDLGTIAAKGSTPLIKVEEHEYDPPKSSPETAKKGKRPKLQSDTVQNLKEKSNEKLKMIGSQKSVQVASGSQNQQVQDTLARLMKEKQVLEQEKKMLYDGHQSLLRDKQYLTEARKALADEKEKLVSRNQSLEAQISILEEDAKDLMRSHSQGNISLHGSIHSLLAEKTELKARIEDLEREKQHPSSGQDNQEKYRNLQKKYDLLMDEKHQIENRLDIMEMQVPGLAATAKHQQQCDALQAALHNLTEEKRVSDHKISFLEKESEELAACRRLNDKCTTMLSTCRSEKCKLEGTLSVLQTEHRMLASKAAVLEHEKEQLEATVVKMEQEKEEKVETSRSETVLLNESVEKHAMEKQILSEKMKMMEKAQQEKNELHRKELDARSDNIAKITLEKQILQDQVHRIEKESDTLHRSQSDKLNMLDGERKALIQTQSQRICYLEEERDRLLKLQLQSRSTGVNNNDKQDMIDTQAQRLRLLEDENASLHRNQHQPVHSVLEQDYQDTIRKQSQKIHMLESEKEALIKKHSESVRALEEEKTNLMKAHSQKLHLFKEEQEEANKMQAQRLQLLEKDREYMQSHQTQHLRPTEVNVHALQQPHLRYNFLDDETKNVIIKQQSERIRILEKEKADLLANQSHQTPLFATRNVDRMNAQSPLEGMRRQLLRMQGWSVPGDEDQERVVQAQADKINKLEKEQKRLIEVEHLYKEANERVSTLQDMNSKLQQKLLALTTAKQESVNISKDVESSREKVFELQRERQGMDERIRALEIERLDLLQAVDSWRDNFKQAEKLLKEKQEQERKRDLYQSFSHLLQPLSMNRTGNHGNGGSNTPMMPDATSLLFGAQSSAGNSLFGSQAALFEMFKQVLAKILNRQCSSNQESSTQVKEDDRLADELRALAQLITSKFTQSSSQNKEHHQQHQVPPDPMQKQYENLVRRMEQDYKERLVDTEDKLDKLRRTKNVEKQSKAAASHADGITRLSNQITRLKKELQEMVLTHEEQRIHQERVQKQRDQEYELAVEAHKEEVNQLQRARDQAMEAKDAAESEADNRKHLLEAKTEQVEEIVKVVQEASMQITVLKNELEEGQELIAQLHSHMEQLTKQLSQRDDQLHQSKDRIKALNKTNEQLAQDKCVAIDNSSKQIAALTEQLESVRRKLKSEHVRLSRQIKAAKKKLWTLDAIKNKEIDTLRSRLTNANDLLIKLRTQTMLDLEECHANRRRFQDYVNITKQLTFQKTMEAWVPEKMTPLMPLDKLQQLTDELVRVENAVDKTIANCKEIEASVKDNTHVYDSPKIEEDIYPEDATFASGDVSSTASLISVDDA